MKTTIKLLSVLILLICTLITNAQDSALYKYKLYKYKTLQRRGKPWIIVGTATTMLGGLFVLEANSMSNKGNEALHEFNSSHDPRKADDAQKYYDKKDTYMYCAVAAITVGATGIIYGIISNITGKRKAKEYQIKLDHLRTGFYYTPVQVGLKLAFKF